VWKWYILAHFRCTIIILCYAIRQHRKTFLKSTQEKHTVKSNKSVSKNLANTSTDRVNHDQTFIFTLLLDASPFCAKIYTIQ